jgi:hypothetical protein
MKANASNASNAEWLCPNCGTWTFELDSTTGWCDDCTGPVKRTLELWLASNADHLEHYISRGYSIPRAVNRVGADVKPICVSCGGVIKRAPRRNVLFCRTTKKCRQFSRRYVYLYRERGFTKAEALAKILAELTD